MAPWRDDPHDVRPMLADLAPPGAHARLLDKPDLVFEPKYDGIRVLVALDGAAPPAIYTRLGRDKTNGFPDLVDPLSRLARRLRRPLLFDGEIVATGDGGDPLAFQYLQDRLHVTGPAAAAAARRVCPPHSSCSTCCATATTICARCRSRSVGRDSSGCCAAAGATRTSFAWPTAGWETARRSPPMSVRAAGKG